MLLYFYFSLLTFLYKGNRFIFILIGIEFLVLNVFLIFSQCLSAMAFFILLCFSVVSSVLGLVLLTCQIKSFGTDNCIF
uniref:NADH dehydrogenase subunit 4L n=1 Tax=Strongyloides papillosus TaxID=174720 RepID=A0A0S3M448_STREA|nr:NADH dehydrogenase subunit 4L [Strongyloides papillosus]BAT21186.1 NADH dehydrogenase subunit 4L [Strongyloides papillosus]